MSEIVYTDSQKKAIKERDKNIIVSAAAGSGKTRVLVDRVIDLMVNDGAHIDKMVIVTFTKKASIEMKDRIRQALEDRLRDDPSNRHYINQLKQLKYAHIQTLHSFASDMLREYFYYFDDLSPSYKVISESANLLLKQAAIDEVFDREYERESESFYNFIHNFATSRSDKNAKEVVLATYEQISSQIDPLGWLDAKTQQAFDFSIFKERVRERIYEVLDQIRKNQRLVEQYDMRVEYAKLIEEDFNLVNGLEKLIDRSWDDFIEKISKAKFMTMVRARKGEKEIQPIIKNNRDSYKKVLSDIAKLVLNTNEDIVIEFATREMAVLAELNHLTKAFMEIYRAKKSEKSYLDFNDMERMFIKLLENPEAQGVLRDRFSHIFFDEYQDSNDVQNYIIELLKREDNLFFVGDVKQSIYGFRRARPRLFIEKLDSYETDNKSSIRINLNENFRTDGDILNFDNFIFDRLMTKESSTIDYKNGGHRLNFTKDFESDYPKAEIHVMDRSIDEAKHIGKVIENLITEGYDYKDIAILLRSGSRAYLYENALKDAEIPFFNDISKVSFGAVEVTFFKNILRLIANPKDDLSLLAVVRSDIYGFTEDDLAEIRINTDDFRFYEAFDSYQREGAVLNKINNFKTEFDNYSYQLALMDLYEFGNFVFENSGYYKLLSARDRAADRIANVESFIDLMSDYEANNDDGLYGFLDYVENLSLYQSDNLNPARSLSENENLVRIMTIHKSKGLEFPVVILAEASKRFNNNHLKTNISFDDELGIGINVADYENKIKLSSLKRDLINEKITKDSKREEMRVLYVAMTRPINKLIVVGEKNLAKVNELYMRTDFLNMNSYMDWILAALSTDKIGEDLFDRPYQTNEFEAKAKLYVIDEENEIGKFKYNDISEILESRDYNKKLYQKFVDLYSKPYKFHKDTTESIKKSVTEITKNFNPENDGYELPSYQTFERVADFRKPNFITDKKEFSPTDRGTIIHKVFQALAFEAYDSKSMDKALARLVDQRRISKEDLQVIDKEKILAYFSNPELIELYKNAINIRKEESFLMAYEDYYVNGQIDLIFEFEDEIIILDFKTDAIKREGLYNDQLGIYKRAVEESLQKNVSKSLIYWYNFAEIELV